MNQQDLVWVRLPFSNFEQSKVRPGVVLSRDAYNASHPDVLLCALTSNLEASPYKVTVSREHVHGGQLPLESMARVDKILQVEKSLIEGPFARVDDERYDAIIEALNGLVGRGSQTG